ncbi:molybdopterin-dependent oxidoreductase [Roseomonas sp. HJA6]|uniref:Molybdopterin-dependent oxidoreductase n=1 Tax=Roseomonas alba TaxID=2846776 RepID=A0ABS7A5K3_9PROT|nr:molybdopterin-dependent oxidoreductase [Neoroseomonas alba]MBW6397563.1 molybdopterin-dependent oxidoreductase [Neoroseomonas alba]
MPKVRVVCAHDCPDMCSLVADVEGDRVVRLQGDPEEAYTAGFACAKVNRDMETLHSPDRLRTPLRRTGPKGSGQFAPITWDEALDEITGRWKGIIATDGPMGILGYAYSAHQGHMNRRLVSGLFHALGASRMMLGTVCDTCCETAWDMTLGPVGGTDPQAVVHSDLVIAWGCDLMAVNVHFWALLEKVRKTGVKLVVIDPRRSQTAARADMHLPIKIGTDAALACGIAHILLRDGKIDRDYVAANTLGFERWAAEVLPNFPPERVAEITGLPVEDIETLAAMYGAAKSSLIRLGEGMTRLAKGGQALRAVVTLPALTGAYGREGGGALLLAAASMDFQFGVVAKPSGPESTRTVNHLALGEALEEMRDPPIRALFIAANNPAVTNPDVNRLRRALMREDLFTVVHDPFMTDTARYADIVLPAATYLETEDFYRSYGSYRMQWGPAAVAPQHQAMSNFHLAQALGQRMGLNDPVFSMTPREIMPLFFKGSTGIIADVDPATVFETPVKVTPLAAQEFRTPSGRLEIYSETLAAQGIPPMPVWEPDAVETADAARWPLRLLTAPGYFQAHTAYSASPFLRKREGDPCAILHPEEASRRGLSEGAKVKLFNDRGAVGLVLRVSDEVQPGVVLVPGQRPDAEAVSGTVNMLCDERRTDMGEGACYQSTFLDVAAWERAA